MYWPKFDAEHLIVTARQMEVLEKKIFFNGMPLEALMEKVGLRLSDWFLERPHLLVDGVIVLVGPGHNGGDGLVVARELHCAGVDVSIWCPISLSREITKRHFSYSTSIGINHLKIAPDVQDNSLWIEALFGLGQSRPLPKSISSLLRSREGIRPGRLISIDVPAGTCSDSGISIGDESAVASSCLTIGLIKQGLVQDSALKNIGTLERIDIGIPKNFLKEISPLPARRICFADLDSYKWPKVSREAMKYQRGRVLVLAGSSRYKGAATLALQGALASGAGSIHAVLPKSIAENLWQVFPEIIVEDAFGESSDQTASLATCLKNIDLNRFDALLLGPGIGVGSEKWEDISNYLDAFRGLLVLDADALNRIAIWNKGLNWLNKRSESPTWITPHFAEFKRVFPFIKTTCPLMAAIEAAQKSHVSVLLKGARSVIADPSGFSWQLGETLPYVARIGLGDVLSGFLTGVGSIGLAVDKGVSSELFAAAVLLHAKGAAFCDKGTNASAVSTTIGKLMKQIQIAEMS